MRHRNPIIDSWYCIHYGKNGDRAFEPYERPYTYTRFSPNRVYIKVLQFIADNPGCKRFDIQCGVWGYDRNKTTAFNERGSNSLLFSNLLYDDLIDYDNKFRYTITAKGMELLNKANNEY